MSVSNRFLKYWLIFFCLSLASCASHQPHDEDKPGMVVSQVQRIEATVVEIDYNNRFVTLQGPGGEVVSLHVDEQEKNFSNVRMGDRVAADYYESVAVYVQRPDGSVPAVSEASKVNIAPEGSKPGLVAADTVMVTAEVTDIDHARRMVTLQGPNGINRRFPVDESVSGLEMVRVGDQLVVQYTMAIAISVSTP